MTPLANECPTTPKYGVQLSGYRNPGLCEDCQPWNDPEFLNYNYTSYFLRKRKLLLEMQLHKSCRVCQVVSSAAQASVENSHFKAVRHECISVEIAYSQPDNMSVEERGDAAYIGLEIFKSFLCVSTNARHADWMDWNSARRIDAPPDSRPLMHPIYRVECGIPIVAKYRSGTLDSDGLEELGIWESRYIDMQKLQTCIADCQREHDHRAAWRTMVTKPLEHFRLIDVQQLCVVEAPGSARFAALSYVWDIHDECGKNLQLQRSNVAHLSKAGSLRLHQLPDSIFDAIMLCRDLHDLYLWVDRLCIVQDDLETKIHQINHMDTIYGSAMLTIVAATNPSKTIGLPGVKGRPRSLLIDRGFIEYNSHAPVVDLGFTHVVSPSRWNTRGWTFQEALLSSRCLYITEHGIFFVSSGCFAQEVMGQWLYQSKPLSASREQSAATPLVGEEFHVKDYMELVSQYTQRTLRFEPDIQKAFAGVASVFAKVMRTRLLFCLPENAFILALLWTHASMGSYRRMSCPEIPSWSWAAWTGHIGYWTWLKYPKVISTNLVFHFQNFDGSLEELQMGGSTFELLNSSNRSPFGTKDDTRSMWEQCPQSIGDLKDRFTLNPIACDVAKKFPGSLVFNTTTASVAVKEADFGLSLWCSSHQKIGSIRITSAFVAKKIEYDKPQTLIVLGAAQGPSTYESNPCQEVFLWSLLVMLVERHEGVCFQMGLGCIDLRLWAQANPKWQTIVLA